MELMNIPSVCMVFFFFFSYAGAAPDPTSAAGALPMCAQVCLTSAFYTCNCTMLDFNCGCTCSIFSPNAKSCIQNSCSLDFQKSALDMVSSTCQTVTSTSSIAKPTNTSSTSTHVTTTLSSTKSSSTTSNNSGSRMNTISTPTSTLPHVATPSSVVGSSSTTASDPGGRIDAKTTTTSDVGGTNPTSKLWGPYGGNRTGSGNSSQCWIVTASGTARSTCAVQASPFNSTGINIKPDREVTFLFWTFAVFLLAV